MRPRHKAAENPVAEPGEVVERAGFNEAAA